MTPERHQQIKRLFLAAVELAPGERQVFLDQACAADSELRGEVQALLDHHRTGTLLEPDVGGNTAVAMTTTELHLTPQQPAAASAKAAAAMPVRPAGTMIGGRYRLVSPLGRGGMGIVYRAEDTELGQTIALKFLGAKLQDRPDAIEFVRREVRTARQITHPNVVRIFDIGQAEGETFISMEFVAGEDLESLVRRVGPLPGPKVLQIAQQLAGGLAAAHEAGILHRDLKPANVMIDGAGNVRVLDFGIASPVDDEAALRKLSGTPGFMAPELIAGEKPSRQSDLFAWGIVIYFAAMGRLPKAGDLSREEEAEQLLVTAGVPSEVAGCIRSCLQADPARRPRSAQELVAALAGGEALGRAVKAGQMPSPELVAAATSWQPSTAIVDALLAAGCLLLLLILLVADRDTLFLTRCGLVKSPEVLQDTAEQVLTSLGYSAPVGPVLTGVTLDTDCLQYVRDHQDIPNRWQKVAGGEIPAVAFWYRQGDPRLPPPGLLGESGFAQIRDVQPGTATVRLDGRGKLLSLQLVDGDSGEQPVADAPNWEQLFELAGLNWADFREAPDSLSPPLFADAVHTWEGAFVGVESERVRVTVASLRNKVVFFEADQPWELGRLSGAVATKQISRFLALRTALWLVVTSVAAMLAWRHVRPGHVDWLGTWRVAAGVLALGGVNWLVGSRHSFVVAEELTSAFEWLQAIVFCGAIAGVGYLAVEPAARRWWPWSIITVRRLLDGRVLEQGIWADVLLGVVVGLSCLLLRQLGTLLNQLLGVSVSGLNEFDPSQNLLDHFGLRYKVAVFITAMLGAVLESLLMLTLVVAVKRLAKSTLPTILTVVVVLTVLGILERGMVSPVDWLMRAVLIGIEAWILVRFGLLPTMVAMAVFYAVNNSPITLDWSRWYAATGFAVVTTVTGILVLSWRLARAR